MLCMYARCTQDGCRYSSTHLFPESMSGRIAVSGATRIPFRPPPLRPQSCLKLSFFRSKDVQRLYVKVEKKNAQHLAWRCHTQPSNERTSCTRGEPNMVPIVLSCDMRTHQAVSMDVTQHMYDILCEPSSSPSFSVRNKRKN